MEMSSTGASVGSSLTMIGMGSLGVMLAAGAAAGAATGTEAAAGAGAVVGGGATGCCCGCSWALLEPSGDWISGLGVALGFCVICKRVSLVVREGKPSASLFVQGSAVKKITCSEPSPVV